MRKIGVDKDSAYPVYFFTGPFVENHKYTIEISSEDLALFQTMDKLFQDYQAKLKQLYTQLHG